MICCTIHETESSGAFTINVVIFITYSQQDNQQYNPEHKLHVRSEHFDSMLVSRRRLCKNNSHNSKDIAVGFRNKGKSMRRAR